VANHLPHFHDAYAHGIHQRVGMIAIFKIYFTANGWNAKTISVMANAMHHACLKAVVFFYLLGFQTETVE
jgi:hypothetical protein